MWTCPQVDTNLSQSFKYLNDRICRQELLPLPHALLNALL
jgi:hypothetical protein